MKRLMVLFSMVLCASACRTATHVAGPGDAPGQASQPLVSAPAQPPSGAAAVPPASPAANRPRVAALSGAAQAFRMEKVPIGKALHALGRAYGFTIVIEPDVVGEVTFESQNGTVRDVINTITNTAGYFYDESDSLVTVKRMKTVLYLIEYPQIQRKSTGTSSVSISSGASYATGLASAYGTPATVLAPGAVANGMAGTLGGALSGNGGSDQNTLQITKENENTFWDDIGSQLKSFLREDENVFVNRFSGIAAITARPRRHAEIKEFIDLLNERINQQVHISAEILEVTLNGDSSLGIDWSQVATRIGGGFQLAGIPGWGATSAATDTAGRPLGAAINPASLNARLQFGKLSALITALQEQGSVRSKSNPKISALNNQTAYIKVGEDDAFFSLTKSTSITTANPVTPTATTSENIYASSTETFGTVLEVTPHVAHSGLITLDVQPVITRLLSVERSPDLQQTRPNKEIKEASTILQLYDGETGLIGGFIYDSSGSTSNRVPGLGSIPGLGRLFRTDTKTYQHTEIVILLTAAIAKRR
jgi:MSHA type pilus biogenesis protein MshL